MCQGCDYVDDPQNARNGSFWFAPAAAGYPAAPDGAVSARMSIGGANPLSRQIFFRFADRWHLMADASEALLSAARVHASDQGASTATTADPVLLTAAERLRCARYRGREADKAMMHELGDAGVPIKRIVPHPGRLPNLKASCRYSPSRRK